MPYCSNCGAENTGAFCVKCGSAIPAGAAGAPGGFTAPAQSGASAAGLSDNVAGALCYILGLLTGVLFLVMAPYNQNPRVKFHAWQSIFFNLAWVVFWIALGIVTGAMNFLALLLLPIEALIGLGGFCYWLFLMYKANAGELYQIPVIGAYARQQAGL